jgi:hypothetical protein
VELRALQQLPIHPNVIDIRIGFGAQLRDHRAIHFDVPAADQFFGLTPGRNPSCGNYFLQAFSGHKLVKLF